MVSGSNSSLNFLVNPPEDFVEGVPPNSQLGVPVFIYIVKRTSGAVYCEITVMRVWRPKELGTVTSLIPVPLRPTY